VEDWCDQGQLVQESGCWTLQAEPDELTRKMPEDLRHLIEQQIERLDLPDQQILEAASVVGAEFSAAAVAIGQDADIVDVEQRCVELARHGLFLLPCGIAEWPDGTLAERFSFTHHLYQEVLYGRIPAGHRVRLHRQVGERLETGYGGQSREIAPELAVHFTRGRDDGRAVSYLQQAADQALSRSACREAVEHLRNALGILDRQPDSLERARLELEIQSVLAPALIMINGWTMPDAEQSYLRARALSEQFNMPSALASAIYGLATIYEIRGEYEQAQVLLEQRLQILKATDSIMPQAEKPLLESHELMACSLYHQGLFEQACEHADEGLKYYHPEWYSEALAAVGENAGVGCHAWAALALWFAGYPDRALARMHRALELANLPNHNYSLASVMSQAGVLHQLRGEVEKVGEYADVTLKLAHEGGFPYRVATGSILSGWALAAQGDHERGIELLQKGVSLCRSMGAIYDFPYYLALLAQACGWAGRCDEGLNAVSEALDTMQKSRRFFCQAEIWRLQGELLLQADKQNNREKAEMFFQQALDGARELQARSLELRVATNLFRLRQQQRRDAAYRLLAQVYNSFTEGYETLDLQQAGALVEQLKAT
jgi:tetratricopeptide (TPR) repeat protein